MLPKRAHITLLFLEKLFLKSHCRLPTDRLTSELHPTGQRLGLLLPAATLAPRTKPGSWEALSMGRQQGSRDLPRPEIHAEPQKHETRDRTHGPGTHSRPHHGPGGMLHWTVLQPELEQEVGLAEPGGRVCPAGTEAAGVTRYRLYPQPLGWVRTHCGWWRHKVRAGDRNPSLTNHLPREGGCVPKGT